jgi:transposase
MRPKGSAKVIAERRRRALKLLDEGMNLHEVGRRVACPASSVLRWRDKRIREGDGVFEVHRSPGRPSRLNDSQKRRLAKLLLKGALVHQYRTDLWTTARVAEIVNREFGVTYHQDHVGRLLHSMGFSCQKPDRKALERDEERIERWKKEFWPVVKKTPKTWVPTSSSSTKAASS